MGQWFLLLEYSYQMARMQRYSTLNCPKKFLSQYIGCFQLYDSFLLHIKNTFSGDFSLFHPTTERASHLGQPAELYLPEHRHDGRNAGPYCQLCLTPRDVIGIDGTPPEFPSTATSSDADGSSAESASGSRFVASCDGG